MVRPVAEIKPPDLVLDEWRRRLAHLTRLLEQADQREWAWLWETRSRILRFLLERYSPEELGQADDAPSPSPDESVEPYVRAPIHGVPTVPAETGRPVRSGRSFDGVLSRLSQANASRYAEAAIETQIKLAEQEAARARYKRLREQRLIQAEEAWRRLIADYERSPLVTVRRYGILTVTGWIMFFLGVGLALVANGLGDPADLTESLFLSWAVLGATVMGIVGALTALHAGPRFNAARRDAKRRRFDERS